MSSGLMSCVRENSPPLELELSAAAAGPLSLPTANGRSHDYAGPTTSTPIGSPVAVEANDGTTGQQQQQQQQPKRRRSFHPLRNLRRIFRRRTINSADSVQAAAAAAAAGAGTCNTLPPPTSSASEKNLRSVSSAAASANANADAVSASSPASPLTHQQLHDSYGTQSLPKSKSYGAHRDELLSVLLGKKRANKQQQLQQQHNADADPDADVMYQTQRQPLGVAVFPDAMSMSRSSYFAEHHHHRQLRSIGDSTHEVNGAAGGAADISDSQRSLSEARLLDVDGDYTRETLSQSHDSVFSESATASSLSIVLKAELTDVLRKRRNRPDASDEDLGLPHSPVSPQRHVGGGAQSRKANAYATRGGHNNVQQDVSSLSLLSVHSTDNEDQSHSHSYSQSYRQQQTTSASSRISSSSSVSMSSEILRQKPAEEEVDAVGLERQRLSHAAAKHKMAIRPVKKKGPSRQHRRTLETAIPEANEQELLKLSQSPSLKAVQDVELKSKTRSLPAGSSLKPVEATTKVAASSSSSSNNTTKLSINSSSSSSSHMFGLRSLTIKAPQGESSTDGDVLTSASDASEPGFLRRLMQRNSKRSIARANDGLEDVDHSQSVAKKLQISTSCLEATTRAPNMPLPNKSRSATSHEQHIQETRQLIKREIHSEGKQGLQAMVSNYGVQPQPPTPLKPKSGPAARQRYVPQELGAQLEEDCLQSSALVQHFERKPRFVGLSSLQQKLTRSNDSMGQHSSSSNSLETSTDEPSPLYYEEKQRKTVEKSRSFRHQQQQQQHHQQQQQQQLDAASPLNSNMPSLPDLSISFRLPASYYNSNSSSSPSSPLSPQGKCVSLGFEINDNQLLQARAGDSSKALHSPQRGSKLLLNSPSANNITQIEQNIDLIVKSPLVNVLRKSGAPASEQLQLHLETPPPPKRPQQLALKQTTTETPKASPQSSNSNSNSSNCSPEQPEFMKIQLNRVDQARLHQKANLVLAKNVKELRSQSSDDLSLRRLSNDSSSSIHITERAQAPSKSSNATPTSSSSSSSNATPTTAHSISLSSSSERLSTPTTPKAKAQPQPATESSSKRVSLE
ncbi:CG30015, partial [Drosophila busckii]